MSDDLTEEFIELCELLAEGRLDEHGQARLVEMATADESLAARLREHLSLSWELGAHVQTEKNFAGRTAAHVSKVAMEREFEFARKVKRRLVRRRTLKGLAIAAVLTVSALPLIFRNPPTGIPATAVATLTLLDEDGEVTERRKIWEGDRLDKAVGMMRLVFHHGAVVAVEAPAVVKVESAMEISLKSGRLNAWCPESAHGFRVRTASASLTDLGTSFGVNVSEKGDAEFLVLDGMVEVDSGSKKMRVGEGAAVAAGRNSPLHEVVFDPSVYRRTWPLSYGILATRGALMPVDPDVPEKLALVEDDHNVLVIPERREVPFDFPIRAEVIEPGTLPGDFHGESYQVEPVPGKRLNSFLIRYNPVGTSPEDVFQKFEGEVTFDRPVLAICALLPSLRETDTHFATGNWDALHRGIELRQINNPPDSVTLSEDRRTVRVTFYAGISTDEVRVILEADTAGEFNF